MKTIGILGGMGPAATADFYRRIVETTEARCDQEHLHVLIENYPGVPDRTAFLLGYGESPVPTLVNIAQNLQRAGADFLVIACNTANSFKDSIQKQISLPLFNWPEEVIASIKERSPDLRVLGLLATDGTIISGMYHRVCHLQGIEVVVPDMSIQMHIMATIYDDSGIKSGSVDVARMRETLYAAECHLLNLGAQALLIGCTELSLYNARYAGEWTLPVFDAVQLAVERVIVMAGGKVK